MIEEPVAGVALALAVALASCSPRAVGAPGSPESNLPAAGNLRAANAATAHVHESERVRRALTGAETAGRKLGHFSRPRAMRHVRRLAGRIGTRRRAHWGERKAGAYVASHFRRLGYRTRIRRFGIDGGTSRNVVAAWPGAERHPPVVVGAHMDTVPGAPGANDNASGVATLLEVARLVAGKRQARFLRLVAFGSEEYGRNGNHHVGSARFVGRLGPKGRSRLAGMLSIDMVADGRPLLIGTSGIGPTAVARFAFRKATKAGVRARYVTLCDCSDNGPFERAGIPAGFMYSGLEPDYHSPSDTVANLVPGDLKRSGRAARAFVKNLRRKVIRRFRR